MKKKFEDTGSCSWQDGEHNEAEESHQDDLGEDPPDKAMLQRMMRQFGKIKGFTRETVSLMIGRGI